MLDRKVCHWEIGGIPGHEARPCTDRRRRDQAVRLTQGDAFCGELATPASRELALIPTNGRHLQGGEHPSDRAFFPSARASPTLFNVDRANERRLSSRSQRPKAFRRATAAQSIDQDSRIQQEPWHPQPTRRMSPPALCANPGTRVRVPVVALAVDLPQRCEDVIPAPLVLESATDGLRYERAPLPSTHPTIELGDETVVQCNVHTHAHKLAN
jgi:hypothetical protein